MFILHLYVVPWRVLCVGGFLVGWLDCLGACLILGFFLVLYVTANEPDALKIPILQR